MIVSAYDDDKERGNVVLHLDPKLAPIQIGVFPLVNKIEKEAKEVFGSLKDCFVCTYDKSGSVGRRYARADELGIPFCVTVDFDGIKDGKVESVTVRDRETTKQIRVEVKDLKNVLFSLIMGAKLEDFGKPIN